VTIILRDFRDSDGPALLAIHSGAILATGDEFYTEAERRSWAYGLVAEGYARARDGGETFVLATTANDTIIGFCSWDAQQIVGLYVDPRQQGRGIGSLLLRHGEDAMRHSGVTLSRIHSSLPAVSFYEAHGYVVTSRAMHSSRGGLPMADAMLEKSLTQE
jgi:ribosomal protein S18 acetylase RimI-like enzyme